ncbi:MAG: hypothetical protein LBQ47_04615 [Endomicrobium sp.]|nr:hypothetical protein [Endomicrobium sp.]
MVDTSNEEFIKNMRTGESTTIITRQKEILREPCKICNDIWTEGNNSAMQFKQWLKKIMLYLGISEEADIIKFTYSAKTQDDELEDEED